MAKPNYSFEKRRKELERKSKKEAKKLQKLEQARNPGDETANASEADPVSRP